MDCSDVRENLAAALDNELRDADLKAVEAHLSTCVDCVRERDEILRLTAAASTSAITRVDIWPRLRAEIDRDIILGLVEQVAALTAEVKMLRSETASMRSNKVPAAVSRVPVADFEAEMRQGWERRGPDDRLRIKAGQQLSQATIIARDAQGFVDQRLIDAVENRIQALTDALDNRDTSGIGKKLDLLNVDLLSLSKEFYRAKTSSTATEEFPPLPTSDLIDALKPMGRPGEPGEGMTVTIVKEGKEIKQGVAYLDDGTMVVVEGASKRVGETLEVVTSSVLQTVAGKMIFASIRKPSTLRADEPSNEGVSDHWNLAIS